MRIAALVPRYHSGIVGGADEYLRRLFRGLHARGIGVEVLTTRDTAFRHDGAHGLLWDNALPATDAGDEAFPVRRFRSVNLPPRLRRRWHRQVDRVRDRARRSASLPVATSHLAWGFHELESWAGSFPFRWTREQAAIDLHGPVVEGLHLEVSAPHPTRLTVIVDGDVSEDRLIPAHQWTEVTTSFSRRARARVTVQVDPTFEPPGDHRALGVAVRAITVLTDTGPEAVPLASDSAALLDALSTADLAAHLDQEAAAWDRYTAVKDTLLKGPLSPGLLAAAVRLARRSDVVLATNVPFATAAVGLLAGRLTGRPVALLPFFHLRDGYHHRRTLRGLLARADRVLCLSRATCAFVEGRWKGRAAWLGGGIDPVEFEDPAIDGDGFRRRHDIGQAPLVVTVARKTPSKGYRTTAAAVRMLHARGIACEHVLIGPDEDGRSIEPGGGRYLGQLPRTEVLSALAAADVFVLPSVHESFGLAYLEAWMLRTPVIGHTLCEPARELIEPGRDGLLVSDAGDLAGAIEWLLADRDRRESFGVRGREKTLAHHTWTQVIDRAVDAFHAFESQRSGSG